MPDITVNEALKIAFELHQKGDLDGAEEIYEQIIAQAPAAAPALHLLGIVRRQRGGHEQAVELFRKSLAIDPDQAEPYYNLGVSLLFLGRDIEAEAAFEKAVALMPSFAEAWNNLGHCRMTHHRPRAGAEAYSNAIAAKPKLAQAQNGLAIAMKDLSRLDEAIAHLRRAIEIDPGYRDAHSNLVYSLHFTPEQILDEHLAWSKQFADGLTRAATYAHDRSPGRVLRIGYVSPDFRAHPVGFSMLPILANHDRACVEAVCFSDARQGDEITAELRQSAGEWHDTAELSDEQLADLIRPSRIDILVDLTMHMTRNRLLVFARRPAPVQMSFLAYPATSGVRAIDYRITDRWLDPPGETEKFNTEKLLRLPDSFWCYPDLPDAPAVAPSPAMKNGYVTFGSLNNPCKFNEKTADLWAQVLGAVPDSHLLMLCLDEEPEQSHQLEMMTRRGIGQSRIELVGHQDRAGYLASYARIDIALDPLPYNGHFTSCDALFQGAPVITLRGGTSVGRAGESILQTIGFSELIAATAEQFIEIAQQLAGDLPRLAQMRALLRDRMRASALMDGRSYTRALESLYRQMWKDRQD